MIPKLSKLAKGDMELRDQGYMGRQQVQVQLGAPPAFPPLLSADI